MFRFLPVLLALLILSAHPTPSQTRKYGIKSGCVTFEKESTMNLVPAGYSVK